MKTAKLNFLAIAAIFLGIRFAIADAGAIAAADNGFAFNLLNQIAKEQPGNNLFISPLSAATALQVVANGAAGETKNEMQNVLKTSGVSQADLNANAKDLNQSLNAQTNVILELANGIWFQNDFHLERDFIATNEHFFDAKLAAVDFKNAKAAEVINRWADKQTRGKIQKIVSFPFPPQTRVILANAIYFKGKWADPFKKSLTSPRNFHLADGAIEPVPMMGKSKSFEYLETDGFQAVKLPYSGGRLEMILVLPATDSGPQKVLAEFSGKDWQESFLAKFSNRDGFLAFPKFKLDYEITLNDALKAIGMKRAFSAGADFSAMTEEPLFISEVKQKSFVDVNEEGTEAAAVTTVTMVASVAIRKPPPFQMIVDRPFLFLIEDRETQTILFMGIVADPKAAE
ncbi:MAG TPA: serpin family protein [Verrucomicrobiae bacterium]|nr:serpin family protein [Verrucomicrobiae bacterium]